jgi:hypothetical protein
MQWKRRKQMKEWRRVLASVVVFGLGTGATFSQEGEVAPAQVAAERQFGQWTPPESLGWHLWTNWVSRTNGRSDVALAGIDEVAGAQGSMATNAVWNTNWFFYGLENFTAMTLARTNAGGEPYFWRKAMIISPVAILQAGHAFCGNDFENRACGSNQWFLAVDRMNGQHWRRCVGGISRWTNWGDYYIGVLERPFPPSVGSMPLVWWGSVSNRLDDPLGRWPTVTVCQHARIIGNPPFLWSWEHSAMSQDSGSPTVIVVSNRLVGFPMGFAAPKIALDGEARFLSDYTNALRRAGHNPNRYPIRIETLEGFPTMEQIRARRTTASESSQR